MTAPARLIDRTVRPAPAARTESLSTTTLPTSVARTHLRVVTPRQRSSLPICVAVTIILVFSSLLGNAVLQSSLVTGQSRLDSVEEQRLVATTRNQRLQLEVARLEAPERVVREAKQIGMIVPDQVTWLTPRPGAGSPASAVDEPPTDPPDERAAGDPADRE